MPPHLSMNMLSATLAIANVLADKRSQGHGQPPYSCAFTDDETVRIRAATLLASIASELDASQLPSDFLTRLATKLVDHLTTGGGQTAEAISAFPRSSLIQALREEPTLIHGTASISEILRTYATPAMPAKAQFGPKTSGNNIPRKLLWKSGDYCLEEATRPFHLVEDSKVLGHRIGLVFNGDALAAASLDCSDPEAINYLRYWIQIRNGDTRVITLTERRSPLATIEYDVKSRAIRHIASNAGAIRSDDYFFPALCAGLSELRASLALSDICGLPQPPPDNVLTADGTFQRADVSNIGDALAGTVSLEGSDERHLANALNNPLITADVSHVYGSALNSFEEIRSKLRSSSQHLFLPALRVAGDMYFPTAQTLSLPALQNCGRIDCPSAAETNLANLSESLGIRLSSARRVSIPNLKLCKENIFPGAKEVFLPELRESGRNIFSSAAHVALPSLRVSGDNYFLSANTVLLPALTLSGSNFLEKAESIFFPALERSGHNYFYSARSISLPRLRSSGDNVFPSATYLFLPALERSGSNFFPKAEDVCLPPSLRTTP